MIDSPPEKGDYFFDIVSNDLYMHIQEELHYA